MNKKLKIFFALLLIPVATGCVLFWRFLQKSHYAATKYSLSEKAESFSFIAGVLELYLFVVVVSFVMTFLSKSKKTQFIFSVIFTTAVIFIYIGLFSLLLIPYILFALLIASIIIFMIIFVADDIKSLLTFKANKETGENNHLLRNWLCLFIIVALPMITIVVLSMDHVKPHIPDTEGMPEVKVRVMDAVTMKPISGAVVVGVYGGGGAACGCTESAVTDDEGYALLLNDKDPRVIADRIRWWGPSLVSAYKRGYQLGRPPYFSRYFYKDNAWYVYERTPAEMLPYTVKRGPDENAPWEEKRLPDSYPDERSALLASKERSTIYLYPSSAKTKDERWKELKEIDATCVSRPPFEFSKSEGGVTLRRAIYRELIDTGFGEEYLMHFMGNPNYFDSLLPSKDSLPEKPTQGPADYEAYEATQYDNVTGEWPPLIPGIENQAVMQVEGKERDGKEEHVIMKERMMARVQVLDVITKQPIAGVVVVGAYAGHDKLVRYADCTYTESAITDEDGYALLPYDRDSQMQYRHSGIRGPRLDSAYKEGYQMIYPPYFSRYSYDEKAWHVYERYPPEQLLFSIDQGHDGSTPWKLKKQGSYPDQKLALLASKERSTIYLYPTTAATREERWVEQAMTLPVSCLNAWLFLLNSKGGGVLTLKKAIYQELIDAGSDEERLKQFRDNFNFDPSITPEKLRKEQLKQEIAKGRRQ